LEPSVTATADLPTTIALDPSAQALLFTDARTANTFTDEPVTDEQVQALYDLVKWAPTSMNSQPLRVVLVRSPEARERILTHMGDGNKVKTAAAPLVAILAADVEFHENLVRTFPHFAGAKAVFANDEARANVARAQSWLQAGYFILGVRALGLAAGPMTGYNAGSLDADLLAGTTLRSIVVINIGHPGPDAWFDRLPRLSYDEVVTTL
jgi:3-hydroxypropanoate dehydrogenase